MNKGDIWCWRPSPAACDIATAGGVGDRESGTAERREAVTLLTRVATPPVLWRCATGCEAKAGKCIGERIEYVAENRRTAGKHAMQQSQAYDVAE